MIGKGPKAPAHLSASTKAWWRATVSEWALELWQLKVLQAAAESWDRAQEARSMILAEGAVTRDRFGQAVTHPAVRIERDARSAFLAAIRVLALDVQAPTTKGR